MVKLPERVRSPMDLIGLRAELVVVVVDREADASERKTLDEEEGRRIGRRVSSSSSAWRFLVEGVREDVDMAGVGRRRRRRRRRGRQTALARANVALFDVVKPVDNAAVAVAQAVHRGR